MLNVKIFKMFDENALKGSSQGKNGERKKTKFVEFLVPIDAQCIFYKKWGRCWLTC